jgi:integrase
MDPIENVDFGLKVSKRVGYWALHRGEYKRHSVDRDVEEFCGWPLLLKIEKKAGKFPNSLRLQGFIAATFLTGGRVSEVLSLRKNNFEFHEDTNPPIIIVKNMVVLKRFKKKANLLNVKIAEIPIKFLRNIVNFAVLI